MYTSTKEKYFNFSVYINLLKLILPKILKQIFINYEIIPKYFIQTIDEIFQIWKNQWKIFDNNFFKGFFLYTYNYNNSYNKIEEYYSQYLNNEINNYVANINKIHKLDSQKIKIIALENGLDTDCNILEIISDLTKIKKIEIIINLSKDIDGNEYTDIPQISEKETSKIQRILKSMNDNYINNDNKSSKNEENVEDSKISKSLNNIETPNCPKGINEEMYNDDIDGEPL